MTCRSHVAQNIAIAKRERGECEKGPGEWEISFANWWDDRVRVDGDVNRVEFGKRQKRERRLLEKDRLLD